MDLKDRRVLLCNCERSMGLDGKAVARALGAKAEGTIHSHLCRTEIDAFASSLDDGQPLIVACTQEAPLFREVAEEKGFEAPLGFVNIRERAGWCEASKDAAPKIAALLAEAMVEARPAGTRTLESDGVCLVYGAGQQALDVARRLSGRLNVSLVLSGADDIMPPALGEVPIYQGQVSRVSGHFGAFEVQVDGYAPMLPSSRGGPQFMMSRDGAQSTCSLIFDMSGGTPLVTGHDKRDGYFHVDPRHPAGVAEAMFEIADMVGEFEKPIYVTYDGDICAHGRNRKTGCTNCLDACPAGAIQPADDVVVIDTAICGGCGSCSASCPTGAVSYAYPRRDDLIRRARALTGTYLEAGGKRPVLLIHDERHGSGLISAMARYGRGLPVNVLPFSVFTVTQIGHDFLAAALLAGNEQIVILGPADRRDEMAPLEAQVALVGAILAELGYKGAQDRVRLLVEQDPDAVEAALYDLPKLTALKPATFEAVGGKRSIARAAITKLKEQAPKAPDVISLPEGAPYGRIAINTEGCTLCLACVSSCPADALHDNPERPQVRFVEQACVQCGLCAKVCPEQVITLEPRFNFRGEALSPMVLHEEEPAECVRCGKSFGTRSTIERISAQLAGKHAMFADLAAQELIRMCDDCRITVQAERGDNPFAQGERPRTRTTEDYLRAREAAAGGAADKGLSIDDFLADD